MVTRMLAAREDVFPDYTEPAFRDAFGKYFEILAESPVEDSRRTIYLMANKSLHG